MNEFILFNSLNGVEKKATARIKFNFENRDYLIYTIEESNENVQIFVSKLIVNNEKNVDIEDITTEEKKKLNEIVYNIVIKIPEQARRGIGSGSLLSDLGINLSLPSQSLGRQEYFKNSSFAITNNSLVYNAVNYVKKNFSGENTQVNNEVTPTWSIPTNTNPNVIEENKATGTIPASEIPSLTVEQMSPNSEIFESNSNNVPDQSISIPDTNNVSQNLAEVSNNNSQENMLNTSQMITDGNANNDISNSDNNTDNLLSNDDTTNNPQLAVMSDPSVIHINPYLQSNILESKKKKIRKAGFANSKYVIVGTVCIVLAIVVGIVAYILITNMK